MFWNPLWTFRLLIWGERKVRAICSAKTDCLVLTAFFVSLQIVLHVAFGDASIILVFSLTNIPSFLATCERIVSSLYMFPLSKITFV